MKKNSSHKTLSIVKRISITNIGIFIIACILSIVATLKLNVEYHIDRDAQMMKVYISNTLSSIDNTLKDMGRVSLIAFSDQMVQDILKGTDYSFDEKMENEEYLTKLYSSMISIRDDVRGIYIFNNEDMVFYSDTWNPFLGFDWNVESFFQDVKINSDLSTNISGCHMYVGTLPEGFKYTQTYTKNIFQENNIYLVRPIRSFSPFEVIGYIALRTPILTLQKICSNYLEDNISYIVADENNNIACSSNERIISQNLKDVYPELLDHMNGAKGSFSLTLNQEKYLCAYQRSDYSNMLLITLKTYESIYDELNILVITCIIITAISALVVLFCVYGFTRKNLKRLTDFSLDIQNFQPGDLTRQYDVGYMDEVGVLKDSFNKMIRRLNDLVISEYQARDQLQKAEISEQKMAMLYLKQQYKHKLVQALNPEDDTMNFNHYEGRNIDVKELIDLCETMPFFADRRVILLEDTGFFKNKCDELADYMKELPDYLCLIFVENEVDKRNRMYKAVKAAGRIGEFVQQDEKTLMRWAAGLLKKEGKMITQRDMELLLTMTGVDMGNLRMELEKIISYTGDRDVVTGEDIQQVCTTQTQNKIFDMVRAVTEKNQKRALDLYYDLLTLKEPPMRILFLLAKQFRQLLLVKEYAEEGIPQPVMASRLGVPSFVVKNIAVCARSYRISELRQAVTDFVDAEEAVKTGRLQDVLSVELLIVKYSSARR